MRIGAQVRQTGGFLAGLRRGEEMGAEVVQLFPQNNRQWRPPARDQAVYGEYREAVAGSGVVSATVCHAPYLINLISPDTETRKRSAESLVANLEAATALGAFGLVLHPGSHRGIDPLSASRRIAEVLIAALDRVQTDRGTVCDVLLENTAGGGGTVGRSFEELAEVIRDACDDPRLGVCIDTQHLWASGVDYGTPARADRLVHRLEDELGLDRLRCLHLNDSKVPFGCNRDRHANLGEGDIGPKRLSVLLGHPALQGLPAVLEVPGIEGHGPGAADLALARRLHGAGVAAWSRRSGRAGPTAGHAAR